VQVSDNINIGHTSTLLLSTTTNFISSINTCYTFQSYWPSSGIKYI